LLEEVRRDAIKGMRGEITEPEHRFFLALLMNAPTRADLLGLVKQRFRNEEPVGVVMRWVEELLEESEEGVRILNAWFPETVDVGSEERGAIFLAACGYFLRREKKLTGVMGGLSAADVKELRGVFAGSALGVLME
jgi:hypothetical protein